MFYLTFFLLIVKINVQNKLSGGGWTDSSQTQRADIDRNFYYNTH